MPITAFAMKTSASQTVHQGRLRGGVSRLLRPLAALLLLGSAACGSDPPQPCLNNPQGCGQGNTCWPIDMSGTFQCLPSKPYVAFGADCALIVGSSTCADGWICAPMQGKKMERLDRCTSYCGDELPCPTGATCTKVSLYPTAPQVSVCILPPPS